MFFQSEQKRCKRKLGKNQLTALLGSVTQSMNYKFKWGTCVVRRKANELLGGE